MNKIIFVFIGFFLFFLIPVTAFSQSTLEYATLSSGVAAAATGASQDKEIEQKKTQDATEVAVENESEDGGFFESSIVGAVYGQTKGVMNRGADLLGSAGTMPKKLSGETTVAQAEQEVQGEAIEETEKKAEPVFSDDAEKVYLKNGKVIYGKIVERHKDYIKVVVADVTLTYFSDEVEKVERMPAAK